VTFLNLFFEKKYAKTERENGGRASPEKGGIV
jgi:hypothetical protein